MKKFRADLHVHSVLSPCGSLEMSPDAIIARARVMKLDIIGITDHNSTRQCGEIRRQGALNGITVFSGVEITTREEVHCLAFFETEDLLDEFQRYLDEHLPDIPNDVHRFGYQFVVDADNQITYTEERLLLSALDQGIDQVEGCVHALHGLFIPAHIDRQRFGLFGQLGFVPVGLCADAFEISPACRKESWMSAHPELSASLLISGSDAHHPGQIGTRVTLLEMDTCNFSAFRSLLKDKHPGKIEILT
jgi:PHP family Zn ribbon phosphoesterase